MPRDVAWAVDLYREDNESDKHWKLRKEFMEKWKPYYDQERLVCLARVFANVELLGCKYPPRVMKELTALAEGKPPQQGSEGCQAGEFLPGAIGARGLPPCERPTAGPSKLPASPARARVNSARNFAQAEPRGPPRGAPPSPAQHTHGHPRADAPRGPPRGAPPSASGHGRYRPRPNAPQGPPARGAPGAGGRGRRHATSAPLSQGAGPSTTTATEVPPGLLGFSSTWTTARAFYPKPSGDATALEPESPSRGPLPPPPTAEPSSELKDGRRKRKKPRQRNRHAHRSAAESAPSNQPTAAPDSPAPSGSKDRTAETRSGNPKVETSKRARLDKTNCPRGECKRPRHDTSRATPSHADAAKADLTVVVTTERAGHLGDHAQMVLQAVEDAMVEEMLTLAHNAREFRGKPNVHEGNLRLWCKEQADVEWLRGVVAKIAVPGDKLVVVRPDDVPRRVVCGLLIPGTRPLNIVAGMLGYQNAWAKVDRWTIVSSVITENTFLVFGVPEDVVPLLLERERRLSYLLGSVYVRFRWGGNRFRSDLPPTVQVEKPTPAMEAAEDLPAVSKEGTVQVTDTGTDAPATTTMARSPLQPGDHPELDSDVDHPCPLTSPPPKPKDGRTWWGSELQWNRQKVRQLFNRAMNTSKDPDWDDYREAKALYKKCIRFHRSTAETHSL